MHSGSEGPAKFAHLHQHTAYSLLDGAARIKDLVDWVKRVSPDDPALAMTDHGNMHGAVEFYKAATSQGVKPILGLEAYVAAGSRFERRRGSDSLDGGYFHLTLLAKTFQGYQNLCRLNSRAWLEGFYMKPRVDHELLREHSEGVIALSGCLGAQIPRALLDAGEEAGERMLNAYLEIYGDDFFIELQNHVPEGAGAADDKLKELAEQQSALNPMLRRLADKYGLAMVATNDGHYIRKQDAKAHEALLAIQTKTTLSDEKRFRFPCEEFYVKSPQEMARAVPESEFPSALANTLHVANLCDVDLPIGDRRVYQMPELPIPEGRTLAEQLRVQTYAGLLGRYEAIDEQVLASYASFIEPAPADKQQDLLLALARAAERGRKPRQQDQSFDSFDYPHLERLKRSGRVSEGAIAILERAEYELGVIIAMDYPDYFLIVADFINWAKDNGIAVGPGRGSGAGSIVAYAIRITNIDPLEFDLLFERFLNPERVSMPDFDIDFSDVRRGEVIDYVRERYGEDKVAHIATFGTLASRAAIKDAARVLEAPYSDADQISKLIPLVYGRSVSISKAVEDVPEVKQAYEGAAREFMDVAMTLEGLTRHASVHAAGVIIAGKPIQELAPVFRSGDGPVVCQYDMGSVEELGFIKMDFLGLRTLSFIEAAVRIIKGTHGTELDPASFPKDDAKTFELLSRGEAAGVFQFESPGMVDTLKKLKPRRIQDLIAVSALYRPGPMENIPTYIRRHHGLEEVDYSGFPKSRPQLESILEETYGIPVYQEQIMQIAQQVAGYSLGQADLLRRAMGKKKVDEMNTHRALFERGASKQGISKDEANRIFDLLEKFANYGFNKSHSAAYGAISYQTAYLKAHYPVEFAAALLSVERGNSDKVAEYVADARHLGIEVLPPDINESGADFTPVSGGVRFGLYGIKNVGDNAVAGIIEERERHGRFADLFDFCKRMGPTLLNRRALEHLIKAGGFDRLGDRNRLLANVETALKWGAAQRSALQAGQRGLFGDSEVRPPEEDPARNFSDLDLLRFEKDALGLYISDHPMNSYPGLADAACCAVDHVEAWCRQRLVNGDGGKHGRCRVVLAGILQHVSKRPTRKGTMMARFEIADESGSREVVAFNRTYEEIAPLLREDAPVVLVAEAAQEDDSVRLVAQQLFDWHDKDALPHTVVAILDLDHADANALRHTRSIIDDIAGLTPVTLKLKRADETALYKTEGLRIDVDKLPALTAECPWLKATVTVDSESLLSVPGFAGRRPAQGGGRAADETPF